MNVPTVCENTSRGPVRWFTRKRCLSPRLMTRVQCGGPAGWKERTHSCVLSSGRHIHAMAFLHKSSLKHLRQNPVFSQMKRDMHSISRSPVLRSTEPAAGSLTAVSVQGASVASRGNMGASAKVISTTRGICSVLPAACRRRAPGAQHLGACATVNGFQGGGWRTTSPHVGQQK